MQLARTAPVTTAATPAPRTARQVAKSLQWMIEPGATGYVKSVKQLGSNRVGVVVQDPSALGDVAAAHYIADNAASILKHSVDGVELLAVTTDHYVGRPGHFSEDEQFFASNIPGVTSQTMEHWFDTNKNGVEDDGEAGWEFAVASKNDAARLRRVVAQPARFSVDA